MTDHEKLLARIHHILQQVEGILSSPASTNTQKNFAHRMLYQSLQCLETFCIFEHELFVAEELIKLKHEEIAVTLPKGMKFILEKPEEKGGDNG